MEDKLYNEDNILEIIDNLEKAPRKKDILRKTTDVRNNDIEDALKLLIGLFKNSKYSISEKIEIILEFNDDLDMDKLLSMLGISFIEYNSIIMGTADNNLIEKIDKKLSSIVSDMTEFINTKTNNGKTEKLCLRNSNLDSEAEEFADKLFDKIYGKK